MKLVHVIKGQGPGFDDIMRNAPPLGNGGEVTFTLEHVNEGSTEVSTPNTVRIQGQIIALHKYPHPTYFVEPKIIIILMVGGPQRSKQYIVLNYEYTQRTGQGTSYDELEFHVLPMKDVLGLAPG